MFKRISNYLKKKISSLCEWFKVKGWKYITVGVVVYMGHIFIETLIVNNILALFGASLPILV